MTVIPSGDLELLNEHLCRIADQATSALVTAGRAAGPAAPQDDITQLFVSEDLVGSWAELSDGSLVVAFADRAILSDEAQAGDSAAIVAELSAALAAAEVAAGGTSGPAQAIVSLASIPNELTENGPDTVVVGAGVFEGDQPVASVGVIGKVVIPAEAPGGSRPAAGGGGSPRDFHLLADVELGVSAELGRTSMSMGELLELQPGGVIELDRPVGTPIDVLVNGTLIARGEVVVVDDAYAVRVTEVVAEEDHR